MLYKGRIQYENKIEDSILEVVAVRDNHEGGRVRQFDHARLNNFSTVMASFTPIINVFQIATRTI